MNNEMECTNEYGTEEMLSVEVSERFDKDFLQWLYENKNNWYLLLKVEMLGVEVMEKFDKDFMKWLFENKTNLYLSFKSEFVNSM